jgi:signal transduction histidine kinase
MSALVDSAVQTTRRICTELRPTILDDLGLVAAIEWQVREYGIRTGIECVLHVDESGISLDGDSSIALFRILQESFTNIIRHAQASRVEIELRREDDNIMMQIKDDGVGISVDKILNPLSHGIRGMIERAWNLGGALSVSDATGGGTVIYALIPSPQQQKAEA